MQGDMLDSSTTIVFNVLLDLGLSLSLGRLIDGHLHVFVKVCNHDGSQRGILGVDHFVIYRPKSVEIKHFLVPRGNRLHFHVWLVPNTMINEIKLNWGHHAVKLFLKMMGPKARQERASVVNPLDKGMDCVTICLDTGDNDRSMLILERFWGFDALSSS
jgi:hypothetical protein